MALGNDGNHSLILQFPNPIPSISQRKKAYANFISQSNIVIRNISGRKSDSLRIIGELRAYNRRFNRGGGMPPCIGAYTVRRR